MGDLRLVISCEHGGNRVPAVYEALFAGRGEMLVSHRGWDPGALGIARSIAADAKAPLYACTSTRLLADTNRSPENPSVFSEVTRGLGAEEKARILARFHRPHRERVEKAVRESMEAGGRVLLLSCHSFTPVLDGKARNADVGLLYDPARESEKAFCGLFKTRLASLRPGLRLRRNYPYRGVSDGLATHLRRAFGVRFLGIELEVNQALAAGDGRTAQDIRGVLSRAFRETAGLSF